VSTARRALILGELGLLPRWVLRANARDAVELPESDGGAALPQAPVPGAVRAEEPASSEAALRTPALPTANRETDTAQRVARMSWPDLKEAVRGCTACPLHANRKQTVFGVGDERADWLFVGEGPGAEEDARGEPFVGQAGKLLDNMLAAIGIKRGEDVYIANVVKCRPPGNRVPEAAEAARCEPFLLRQIALIQPKMIVALGKTAASNLLGTEASIGSLRGRLHDFHGTALLVTYHPAYLLRNLPDKAKAWEDLCLARDTMQRLKSAQAAPK
jgi:uracil-DNA glycosylase family 4